MRYRKDGKYVRGEKWWAQNRSKMVCKCVKCGTECMKNDTPGLYLRKNNNEYCRILCRICPECLPKFLDDLGVKMPE